MDHAVIPAPARFDADGGPRVRLPAGHGGRVRRYPDRAGRRAVLRADRPAHGLAPGASAAAARRRLNRPSRSSLPATAELAGLPATAGLSPGGGDPAGERYSLVIEEGQVVVRAAEPAGVARGLTTLLQLVASGTEEFVVPRTRILDAPRYAWRGLSLDVARTFFTVEEIRRVIDLLELYKLNVLHLHLTDDQAWRAPPGPPGRQPGAGRPLLPRRRPPRPGRLRRGPLRHDRSRDRHARAHRRAAAAAAGPESGRNEVEYEFLPGHRATPCGSTRTCPRPSS